MKWGNLNCKLYQNLIVQTARYDLVTNLILIFSQFPTQNNFVLVWQDSHFISHIVHFYLKNMQLNQSFNGNCNRLKTLFPYGSAGSSPAARTITTNNDRLSEAMTVVSLFVLYRLTTKPQGTSPNKYLGPAPFAPALSPSL